MGVTFKDFQSMVNSQVKSLPASVRTTVLSQVESIYTKVNILDQDTKTLNEEEFANAKTIIDVLIEAAKTQHAAQTKNKPSFGLVSDKKDGAKFTEQLKEYKALQEEYDRLTPLIHARAEELGLNSNENYFKKCDDKELVALCNRQDVVKARQDEIYKNIENQIKDSPVGTKFQCGEYVITHQRAYTDETGDRMLVFDNLY